MRPVAWVSRLAGALSTLTALMILVLVMYAVVQRYILNTPLKWGDEMLGYLLVAFVMMGAAEAYRHGDHIAIDLLSQRVGRRPRLLLDVFSDLCVIGFALVLGHSTWQSISFAISFGSYSPGYLEVATWIPQVPMMIGAVLLGLVAAARLFSRHPGAPRS